MLVDMDEADDRRSYRTERLGVVLGRVLARAAAQMAERGAATPEGTRQGNAGGVAAVVQPTGEIAASRAAGMDGQRIRDAARLPLGEGRDQKQPRARLPLFIPGE